jgi:hypothetical protein
MLLCRSSLTGAVVIAVLFACGVRADESRTYPDIVAEDAPVAWWRFEQDGPALISDSETAWEAAITGDVRAAHPGPRPAAFPLFADANQAIQIPRGGGHLRVSDPGEASLLDFDAGDSITLEAWVAPATGFSGGYAYILGKGRTDAAKANQNYALRLHGKGGGAAVSFLFRSRGEEGDWHRWTSNETFPAGDGWHHVAVTYSFGDKDSIRGYIDGEPVKGTWDMGGATDRAPVVDDDELWIGSSMGGQPGSTFHGGIDEAAIYRTVLSAERIRARYRYASAMPEVDLTQVPNDGVLVEIFEGVPDKKTWDFRPPQFSESYVAPAFGFPETPRKYTATGVIADRSNPYLIRATGYVTIPAGPQRLLVRARNAARVYVAGKKVVEAPFFAIPNNGHGTVWELDASLAPNIRALRRGDQQGVTEIEGDGERHLVQLEMIVGGQGRRPELGDACIALAPPEGDFQVLNPGAQSIPFTEKGWTTFVDSQRQWLAGFNATRRKEASREETAYWAWRHELARDTFSATPAPVIPENPDSYPAHNEIDRWINARLAAAGEKPNGVMDDLAFLRRVSLDVIGLIPSSDEIEAFLADPPESRRKLAIDRLLAHPSWGDHWMGYWQDVLAENPNIVNPTLNNTGPFRVWLHESFSDNKPFDRFVTELVMMEGSEYFGGPAGFGMATQNDAPMAAKAHIVGQAFLGLEMRCARCHDAPFHEYLQEDLFSVAAMLRRDPQPVPATSSVPVAEGEEASLLVSVTLSPGSKVAPKWPFPEIAADDIPEGVLRREGDSRERLAALITSPHNTRFPQVIVNRLWRRYLGRGIVEPVDDWEYPSPSHPELLEWLAREFAANGYDLKHVARLILNSHVYQRQAVSAGSIDTTQPYLFAGPIERRMTAEQLVDSLFRAAGKEFDAGAMNVDIDSSRNYTASLNLGEPTRSWMFSSLSNERDRPSLALPLIQPFVEVLETFGWRGSRQDPLTVRSDEATVLQPGVLAGGVLGRRLTRLSEDSGFTALALREQSVEELVDQTYRQILTREPNADERAMFVELLRPGYDERKTGAPPVEPPQLPRELVGWSNHLDPEANVVKQELEKAVRKGDPPTARLTPEWRERVEDMVWTLMNSPEFLFVP